MQRGREDRSGDNSELGSGFIPDMDTPAFIAEA
jgi:hypothetical protein